MRHILKCSDCGKYTMKETCECGNKAIISRPMKYSLHDRFEYYRRKVKINEYLGRGLL